jgi:hypothetical protein
VITVKTNLPDFKRQMEAAGKAFIPIAFAATRAAASEIAKAVRGAARTLKKSGRSTGRLARSVVIKRARRNVPRGTAHYIVGIRQGKAAQRVQRRRKGQTVAVNLDAFYWRWLEGGWVPRGPGSALAGGRRTKALQARRARAAGARRFTYPFISPAFRTAQGGALSKFYSALETGVAKLK